MKISTVQMIEVSDWDKLVQQTYGRPYCYQQQYGCQSRGIQGITIPAPQKDPYDNDTVPEVVNGDEMGVSFKAWLARDPKQKLVSDDEWDVKHGLGLWWERNFFPDIQMVANDLHAKGLIPAGDYTINIDW